MPKRPNVKKTPAAFRGLAGVPDWKLFKPTVGKLGFVLVLMLALLLLLLIDLPEPFYSILVNVLAWPLMLITNPCGGERACQQSASFAGVLLMVIYWYLTASLVDGIWALRRKA